MVQKSIKYVCDYISLYIVINIILEILEIKLISRENSSKLWAPGLWIKVQITWNWVKKLGFSYHIIFKNIYIDGDKRKIIVK